MKDRTYSSLMRCASNLQRLFFLALFSVLSLLERMHKVRRCRVRYSIKVGNL